MTGTLFCFSHLVSGCYGYDVTRWMFSHFCLLPLRTECLSLLYLDLVAMASVSLVVTMTRGPECPGDTCFHVELNMSINLYMTLTLNFKRNVASHLTALGGHRLFCEHL